MPASISEQLGMRVSRMPGGHGKKIRSLKTILNLIERGKADHRVRVISSRIIKDVREGDYNEEVKVIARWIKKNVRYQRDPNRLETIADAWDTIRLGFGDCDDLTVLAASMLESIGQPVQVRVVGHDVINHVFIEYLDGSRWRPLDIARPEQKMFQSRSYPLDHVIKKKEEELIWNSTTPCHTATQALS